LQRKLLGVLVIVIIVVAAIAAWQFIPKTTDKTIKIGLVAPVSGSPIGQDMEKAAEMAVDEINGAGGIQVNDWGGKAKIELIIVDTIDDSPGNAVTPVTRAIESDNVDMLIGGYGSAGTLANEKEAIDARVPYIISGASNPLVTRRGPQGNYGGLNATDPQAITDEVGMSYIFHYCTLTNDYSKTCVDFYTQVMKPLVAPDRDFRLAIMYRNDAFGQSVDKMLKFWIQNESLPIDLVADRSYDPKTTNYQTDLTVVAGTHPDAILVVDNPDKTPLIMKQGWNDVGLKTVYTAVENNQDPTFYTLLGQTGDGQLLESKMDPFMTPSYLPAIQTFSTKFNQTYGVMPGMMGADTYDAFYIAKNAIERAGTVDKAAVRDALETTDMPQSLLVTFSGRIRFDTGINYHEINALTFMEQLYWDSTANALKSRIVWPATAPGISGAFKQADFALPTGYEPAVP
jgi:branched-chain amino acid transport system substrate-binding protein